MNFYLSFKIVFPLFVYMGIGVIARLTKIIDNNAASRFNKLCFTIFLPLTMARNVLDATKIIDAESFRSVMVLAVMIVLWFVVFFAIAPLFSRDVPHEASFIQGCFRANSVLFGIPVAQALYGAEGAQFASICVAVFLPIYNVLSVCALELKRGRRVRISTVFLNVMKNPNMIGAIVGALLGLISFEIPDFMEGPVNALYNMTTPLTLIIVGAQIRFDGILKDLKELMTVCFCRLVLVPASFLIVTVLLGYSKLQIATAFALSAVPTSVSSYPIAQQMGADGPFAAEIVAITTTLSLFTIFLWVSFLTGAGVF